MEISLKKHIPHIIMENSKKINTTNILITALVVVAITLTGYLSYIAVKYNLISLPEISIFSGQKSTLNTEALYLSTPITNFKAAKITEKSKDSISVDVATFSQTDSNNKSMNFKFNITNTTSITKEEVPVPYLLKQPEPPSPYEDKLSIKDLTIGDTVDVSFAEDIRFTKAKSLNATSIIKRIESNILIGTVTEISENSIKIIGIIPPTDFNQTSSSRATPPSDGAYTVIIPSDTEIVAPRSACQISDLSSLELNSQVTVFSTAPIANSTFSAAKINISNPSTPID